MFGLLWGHRVVLPKTIHPARTRFLLPGFSPRAKVRWSDLQVLSLQCDLVLLRTDKAHVLPFCSVTTPVMQLNFFIYERLWWLSGFSQRRWFLFLDWAVHCLILHPPIHRFALVRVYGLLQELVPV
jgi:hypothetical protein